MPLPGERRYVLLPVYSKISQVILAILGFFYILYIGQDILIPLVFSFVFSILLNPLVGWFCSKGMNRMLAISLALLIFFLVIFGTLAFVIMQASLFTESLPGFKEHFMALIGDLSKWASARFNIPQATIDGWIAKAKTDGMSSGPALIGQTLGTVGGAVAVLLLFPVYMFTILYYKPLLLQFVKMLFHRSNHSMVAEVLDETKTLITSYLMGLFIELILVAAMNSGGLLIIGVKYAVLLGVIGALLNIIPYIGGVIAVMLPVLMAIASGNTSQAIWVVALYLFVQFIDNNIIVTRVVASKVKINALISIVVVLIGGALWGISGMFLSIPVTALLKIVFDRIEPFKPYGYLLGDNQPDVTKAIFRFRRKKPKAT